MKKTQIWGVNVREVNTGIEELEADGWEILSVQVLTVPSEYLRDTIYKVAYITAQKEEKEDKSIYEKMYLLEQYCTKYRANETHLCDGCGLAILCDKYEGNSSYLWEFDDVEKGYELIRDKKEEFDIYE